MDGQVYTVGELTQWIKDLLETEIDRIWVRGEISGYKEHRSSGHAYFSLRDDHALIQCVMWASTLQRHRVPPREGVRVRAAGRVSLYPPRGQYQLYVDRVVPDGEGELQAAFLRLKEKLDAEGLFSAERKRPLPRFPRRIGVVTSRSGAAVVDILRTLERRWPLAEVLLSPAIVQGPEAPRSIVRALRRVATRPGVDVIIVGRGGGALEDLWAFNEEIVARAICECPVPVVSAVGHEVDFTISDFVADLRAATPTHAAEALTPDAAEVRGRLARWERLLRTDLQRVLERGELRLDRLRRSRGLRRPEDALRQHRLTVDRCADRLRNAIEERADDSRRNLDRLLGRWAASHPEVRLSRIRERLRNLEAGTAAGWRRALERRKSTLGSYRAQLHALSPVRVLERGYGIVRREGETAALREAGNVRPGQNVRVTLHRGRLACRVERVDDGAAGAPDARSRKEEAT